MLGVAIENHMGKKIEHEMETGVGGLGFEGLGFRGLEF